MQISEKTKIERIGAKSGFSGFFLKKKVRILRKIEKILKKKTLQSMRLVPSFLL